MIDNSNGIVNNDLRTFFSSVDEIAKYMTLLRADKIAPNIFRLDNVDFSINPFDEKILGISFDSNFIDVISRLLKRFKMSDSILGKTIISLDALVLIYTALNLMQKNLKHTENFDQEFDKHFRRNLRQVRKEMLLSVLQNNNTKTYKGNFSFFDNSITPFLDKKFNLDSFLDQCIFNTNGCSSKNGKLTINWRTRKRPELVYGFQNSNEGNVTFAISKGKNSNSSLNVFHFLPTADKPEEVEIFSVGSENHSIHYFPETGIITEKTDGSDSILSRRATEDDIEEILKTLRNLKCNDSFQILLQPYELY